MDRLVKNGGFLKNYHTARYPHLCSRRNHLSEFSLMFTNCLNSKPIPLYNEGLYVREWMYVKDHCQYIRLIIHNGRVGEVYNVGNHNEMRNIVKLICKALGKPVSFLTFVTDRKGHNMCYTITPIKINNKL